jgi:hypothetical protein
MILNKLKSKTNSGALIRVSAPIEKSPDEALEILHKFLKEISPLLSKYLI